jgi:D-arabinose 1-dehydrogenase
MTTTTKPQKIPLSTILPPLILGSATFNNQYNTDPYALPTSSIVAKALDHGIRGFDTSPYYGPAEDLLGEALEAVRDKYPRESYVLLTKVGRIAGDQFDFSGPWVRKSVESSLRRLKTSYLDLVFCHDVEFAEPTYVLEAINELRKLRDEGVVRNVGISGYPVPALAELAAQVLRETGEPLDAVMSYGHYTLQNTTLVSEGLPAFKEAGVECVLNASLLGMGLLRSVGVPVGARGDWHPAPSSLREAVAKAAKACQQQGEKLEDVALYWALDTWLERGARFGSTRDMLATEARWKEVVGTRATAPKIGVSVLGVSGVQELDETVRICKMLLNSDEALEMPKHEKDSDWPSGRIERMRELAEEVKESLGEWFDHSWESPPAGSVKVKSSK